MRTASRRFVLVAGLVALTGGAMAQPSSTPPNAPGPGPNPGGPGMMGGGRGMMMGRGGMGRHDFRDHAAYLEGVKAELRITEAQDGAWKTYADIINGAAAQMEALHKSMWEAMGTATWEERRDMMNRAFQARQQAFQSVHDAALALLPSLTDLQKGKAEYVLPGLARRGMGGRGMGGPGMRGPGMPGRTTP